MGDEVQAIKAGLLEVADLVVVNKGDKPGAQRTAAQLRAMLVPRRRRARWPASAGRARSGPRSWSRPPRPARASRSCSRRSIAIGPARARTGRPSAAARLARAEAPGLGDRRRPAPCPAAAPSAAAGDGGGRSMRWRAIGLTRTQPRTLLEGSRRLAATRRRRGYPCGMTIERVFVAGAGLMGHGIAQVHAAIGKQ